MVNCCTGEPYKLQKCQTLHGHLGLQSMHEYLIYMVSRIVSALHPVAIVL